MQTCVFIQKHLCTFFHLLPQDKISWKWNTGNEQVTYWVILSNWASGNPNRLLHSRCDGLLPEASVFEECGEGSILRGGWMTDALGRLLPVDLGVQWALLLWLGYVISTDALQKGRMCSDCGTSPDGLFYGQGSYWSETEGLRETGCEGEPL